MASTVVLGALAQPVVRGSGGAALPTQPSVLGCVRVSDFWRTAILVLLFWVVNPSANNQINQIECTHRLLFCRATESLDAIRHVHSSGFVLGVGEDQSFCNFVITRGLHLDNDSLGIWDVGPQFSPFLSPPSLHLPTFQTCRPSPQLFWTKGPKSTHSEVHAVVLASWKRCTWLWLSQG